MSFTYSLSDNVGRVRLLLGDTVSDTANFTDEEIEYFLDTEDDNVNLAAAMGAESMAAKVVGVAKSETIGSYSINQSSQPAMWLDLAKRLRDKEDSSPAFDVCDDITTSFHEPE